jgi:hypothetical protein
MTEHPITPPPELVQQWINEEDGLTAGHIATQAAQWGADHELEACCAELLKNDYDVAPVCLRASRRPKPPSLKARLTEAIQNEDLDTALRLVEVLDDSL